MSKQDPHSYSDESHSQIKHIDFHFSVDFKTQIIQATANYTLDRESGESLFLDTSQLNIKSVYSDGKKIQWNFDKDDSILGQRLHIENIAGLTEFTIEYFTSSQAAALQWTAPVQTAGKVHPFLYSQCQPIHARSLFPCQDSPSVRFTYNAIIEVPNPLVAVMAAQAIDSTAKGSSTQYSFEMKQPIPSYLFALAVGNLVFSEIGPRTGLYGEPEIIQAAAWEYVGNEKMLSEAEKLLGPYLWDRYDILIMPPSFPYGGMENPRLTFLNSIVLVGDRSFLSIIYHELAHAWTGNLVTNASWDHFWINEGWTRYAEIRIAEALEGKDKAQLLMAVYLKSLLQTIDSLGADSDITRLRTTTKGLDPDKTWSAIPYDKGFQFLMKLEAAVGRKIFDTFLQKYIIKYQFRSITTEEFLVFLEKELPKAVEVVDVQNWVFDRAIPKVGFEGSSSLYDETMTVLDDYLKGNLPSKENVANWEGAQLAAFLQGVLDQTPIEDCEYLDELFDLANSKKAGVLSWFFEICINSGYQKIIPRVEKYLGRVGRGLLIAPIYSALVKQEWSRKDARRIFDNVKKGYHPVQAKNIESILDEAGI
jgi:aminopeptidase N